MSSSEVVAREDEVADELEEVVAADKVRRLFRRDAAVSMDEDGW